MNGGQRNGTNAQIWGKENDSNYDGNCTARHFRFGTYKISGRWIFVDTSVHTKGKGKAVPLQAWRGPEGSRKFRLPDFHDIRHMKVVRLSASRTGRLYPQEMFLILIFTRGWVDPRAMVRSEGNMSLKNPVTPPGIVPGTVRLVAQRLNHYATPDPYCSP